MQGTDRDLSLLSIFLRFLRFGFLAWGGPVAQIGLIKNELVEERRWLTPSRFNRLLAIYQILPGPEAHELCVHLGMMKRGRWGGLLAGLGFMLPGFVLIFLLAWAYRGLDLTQPLLAASFAGLQIGVIALVARAVHRIGEHALSDRWLWALAAMSASAAAFGTSFWIILPVAGLAYAAARARRHELLVLALAAGAAAAMWTGIGPGDAGQIGGSVDALFVDPGSVGPLTLFLSGLKAGLLTFGGAYTAIPFIRDDAIGRGWMTDSQFLDGLALSGIIPAPLIIFATFVGYVAGGAVGALAMTAGIFLPAFAFTLLFFNRLETVIEDSRLHAFLAGVTAGVVGLIALTAVELGAKLAAALPSLILGAAVLAAALATLYLWRSKLAVPAVVLGSGAAGMALF